MRHHSAYLAAVIRAAILLVALAGCAPPGLMPQAQGAATPIRAILYRDTVSVEFADGTLCTAPRPPGAASWEGTLIGCPHRRPYAVTPPAGVRPARLVLAPVTGGPGAILRLGADAFGTPGPA